jgi:hypothetical protein
VGVPGEDLDWTHQKIEAELTGVGVNLNILVFRLRSLSESALTFQPERVKVGRTNLYQSKRIGRQTWYYSVSHATLIIQSMVDLTIQA